MLNTRQTAEVAGLTVGSLRSLVSRGTFPRPDGYFWDMPWWRPATVAAWQSSRRGPGRPRKDVQP